MVTSPILRAATTPFRGRPGRPKQTSLTLFPTAARHGNCESACEASSPTPEPDRSSKLAAELVGIARLAASSPCADARRGTEYFLLPVRSILNQCDSERVPFRWTVNPYRGCEFGCRYCYARYTHEYMELDGADFEKKIYAKRDAGPLAARDLDSEKIWGEHIAIGTATDPYQPAEQTFRATRAILEEMAKREGLSISMTTKSDKVLRDIDVLKRIAERSSVSVNLSITTLRTRLARLLEPRAPRPDLRLGAVRRLRDAGIAAGVLAMPVLPGLTDREKDLDALARAARDAGAQWFAANVLFLMPSSQKQFLPFIDQKFPKLARQYREWYGRNGYAPETYQHAIAQRVEALRRKYSLGGRPSAPARGVSQSPQLTLAWKPESALEPKENRPGLAHIVTE
ncbi:MAG: radical SAM protein [Candidatus Acidiferrales bacterium]